MHMNSFTPTRTLGTPGWLWKCGVEWSAAMAESLT
jgi:hypothetical protein